MSSHVTALSHVTADWFSPVSVANELTAEYWNTYLVQLQHISETLHQCCQVCGFPLELGYFNTVAVRWSGPNNVSPWNVNYTTKVLHQKNVYFTPWGLNTIFTGDPPWNAMGLILGKFCVEIGWVLLQKPGNPALHLPRLLLYIDVLQDQDQIH